MKVLVIIVTYNGMRWMERCLNSVFSSKVSMDVYLVDNGSTDGTQDYVKTNYPQVLFCQSQENLGFGKANNLGLQYAIDNDYDYVYLLNQDAWVMPETLSKLIEIRNKNPKYGILSPFQLQANLKHLDRNFVAGACSYLSNPYLMEDLYFRRVKEVYDVPRVMAAHWLISRECILQVGGFSPTFPHYGEDSNYADRTIYHGFKIGIVPDAIAVHDREDRVETNQQKIYMGYVECLVLISDISRKVSQVGIRIIDKTFKTMIHTHSLKPLMSLWKIITKMNDIKSNFERSKGYCSFLKLPNL